jgi:hypothetical protein
MIDPVKILAGLPAGLRDPLLKTFREIGANYLERRWEPSELNGGKFCEVVYSIVEGALKGKLPQKPEKPRNMVLACRTLEALPANPSLVGDHSLRILIPRLLPALYDIRNNRGVGHIGGDVDPNFLDATAVYGMATWVLAELIRIFHNVSTTEAQGTVTALSERKIPLIWEVEGKRRILDTSVTNTDQVLVLLHSHSGWVSERDLFDWIEYSNPSVFRKSILRKLHRARLIEYDEANSRARVSPTGIKHVEENILKSRTAA